jgi:hypothetical protein
VSLDIRQEQGLVNSKVAACATNEFVHGLCVNEFEAVAKSVSLASRRKNHHRSGRKREVQLQNLAQGRFKGQHRGDPGLADVNGTPLQPPARPRINPDIDLKFEPGMAAGLDRVRIHRAKVLLHFLRRVPMGMAFSMPVSWNQQVFDSTRVKSSAGMIERRQTRNISAAVPDFRQ